MKMWIARRVILLVSICTLGQAQAHWTEQPDLPDWAQRGKLYWCLHYSTHTRALVDLFLDGGQTLVHGGGFDSPATAEYAWQRGLRWMPYVCSRTTTIAEMAKHAELKEAVLLKPDGSEFLAYNNPVRRYGSLFAPAWPEYVRQCTARLMDRPDAAAVFYDNVYVNDDHRGEAVAAWKQWAAVHGIAAGDDVPALREAGPRGAAGRVFQAEALVAYYAGLRAFNRQHQPPLLISPNLGSLPGYGPAIMEAGAVDLVFYETMSHPPFENNAYRYKLGLAASHGRPTGILAYLPEKIAAERGTRTWHEGMHYFFYPSSPLAEEVALAVAEAAACGGTYIPCYNLFPSLPITDLNDPFDQRIHRAIKQSYAFLHAHQPLYAAAAPGSNVAIFHSTATQIQDRRGQNNEGLAQALLAAGIPFEVVVAADLTTAAGARGLDTLVVQNAVYLDQSTATGILRFAERGGRVVLSGGYAGFDPLGRPVSYAPARQLMQALRLVAVPLAQWKLEGFEPEGTLFRVKKHTAQATLRFNGTPGRYAAHIHMLDENDGTSPFSLAVGGKMVFQGKLDFEDERMHWFSSPPFDLAGGDTLTFTIHAHAGERGRTEAIVLAAADAGTGAAMGRGQVVFSPGTVKELPAEQLVRLTRPRVRVANPGKATVNVLDCPGRAIRTVHLVNYDFRYHVTIPGLYATDDGQQKARTPLTRPQVVIRKRLHVANPQAVVEPVLQVYGLATPKCTAELAVALNGRPAGRISQEAGKNRGWFEMPLDRSLLGVDNQIEIRAEGQLGNDRWWQIGIDTATHAGGSFYSSDGGKSFTAADLSPDLGTQTGEFMIRIEDRRPDAAGEDPRNLAHNPGFEAITTLHGETVLSVRPAERIEVLVEGSPRPCLALSPEAPPAWLRGEAKGGTAVYTVPRVGIYTMLALADSRSALEPLVQAEEAAAPWKIPPVTTPLRKVLVDWRPYGQGFTLDDAGPLDGKQAVRCENDSARQSSGVVQQIDLQQKEARPIVISAWSRAENVSGKADSGYSIFVDATCDDGSVMNGLNARFPVGTHSWNQATLKISPTKPIRVLNLHLLFRGHSGRVWFDEVSARAG
jgi:hypothetical protein